MIKMIRKWINKRNEPVRYNSGTPMFWKIIKEQKEKERNLANFLLSNEKYIKKFYEIHDEKGSLIAKLYLKDKLNYEVHRKFED